MRWGFRARNRISKRYGVRQDLSEFATSRIGRDDHVAPPVPAPDAEVIRIVHAVPPLGDDAFEILAANLVEEVHTALVDVIDVQKRGGLAWYLAREEALLLGGMSKGARHSVVVQADSLFETCCARSGALSGRSVGGWAPTSQEVAVSEPVVTHAIRLARSRHGLGSGVRTPKAPRRLALVWILDLGPRRRVRSYTPSRRMPTMPSRSIQPQPQSKS